MDQIEWTEQEAVTGWLKELEFPVRLARQVFTNKDGSTGTLYLACSQLTADWDTITTIYQKQTMERRGAPQLIEIECGIG